MKIFEINNILISPKSCVKRMKTSISSKSRAKLIGEIVNCVRRNYGHLKKKTVESFTTYYNFQEYIREVNCRCKERSSQKSLSHSCETNKTPPEQNSLDIFCRSATCSVLGLTINKFIECYMKYICLLPPFSYSMQQTPEFCLSRTSSNIA